MIPLQAAAAILRFLAVHGTITSRIRELRDGDVQDLPRSTPEIPGGPFSADELLEALEELELAGCVQRSEQVHPWDSSEYRVLWRLV